MQFTIQAYEIASRGRQEVCEAIAMEQRDNRGWLEFPDASGPQSGFRDADWAAALQLLAQEWILDRTVSARHRPTTERQRNARRLHAEGDSANH